MCIFEIVQKLSSHIRKYKRIAILWLIVFSLAPCTVKEAWLSTFDIDYSKPLNQSRTTVGQQCQFTNAEQNTVSLVKKVRFNREPAFSDSLVKNDLVTAAEAIDTRNLDSFSGNSPPKYILYKRLKLDVA
ncbi:hypothetical protein [Pedobacter africanus]|uniref:Uncharacterized protein n=1 Tax=Pedobacter africanus TaxID=151894 RepID=A0A1W2BSJ8_9SPHI|nr:hypothetical protein [Pedobacter africanus]SMC75714.1 hypothetical protein SAMN04488524_2593 [Pedobacter africanus]